MGKSLGRHNRNGASEGVTQVSSEAGRHRFPLEGSPVVEKRPTDGLMPTMPLLPAGTRPAA